MPLRQTVISSWKFSIFLRIVILLPGILNHICI
jgi:hypothetical protein